MHNIAARKKSLKLLKAAVSSFFCIKIKTKAPASFGDDNAFEPIYSFFVHLATRVTSFVTLYLPASTLVSPSYQPSKVYP